MGQRRMGLEEEKKGMNGNSTITALLTFCPQSFFFHIAAPDYDPFCIYDGYVWMYFYDHLL